MEQTLEAISAHLKGRLIGDGSIRIHNVNNLEAVQEGELTFAEDAYHLARAMETKASAVIVSLDVRSLPGRAGISVPNPRLAFAQTLALFHPQEAPHGGIHPSAVLGDQVQLGGQVDIRANAVLGHRVRIGRGTVIEPGTFLGDDVTIGEDCLVGPNAVIYRRTRIGDRVRIHGGAVLGGDGFGYVFHEGRHIKVPQVGDVVIEDDVEIGCNVCIDRATVGSTTVGRGTKIDNLVQVAHNDQLGKHVILAGHVGLSGSVTIGDYTVLGGKAGVVDHVTIGARAQIGAASVVTKAVASGETVWGFPARPVQTTKQQMASLSRLPSLLKAVAQLLSRFVQLESRVEKLEGGAKRTKS